MNYGHLGILHPFGAKHSAKAKHQVALKKESDLESLAERMYPHWDPNKSTAQMQAEAKQREKLREVTLLLERPLDFFEIDSRTIFNIRHEQFYSSDGSNFGKFSDGIRADTEALLHKYERKRTEEFKTEYIKLAQAELADEHERIVAMYDAIKNLPLSDNMLEEWPVYELFTQNCLQYAISVIKRAETIARKAGDSLTY